MMNAQKYFIIINKSNKKTINYTITPIHYNIHSSVIDYCEHLFISAQSELKVLVDHESSSVALSPVT